MFKELLNADDTIGINFTPGLLVKTLISDEEGFLHCENDPWHCNIILTGLLSETNQAASGNRATYYCFLILDWTVFCNLFFGCCCVWKENYIFQADEGCALLLLKMDNLPTQ